MHKKYVGQKRFSLEGGETLIPALDLIFERAAEKGVKEFIVGMSHRGRLNTLSNILENLLKKFLVNLMVKIMKIKFLMEM